MLAVKGAREIARILAWCTCLVSVVGARALAQAKDTIPHFALHSEGDVIVALGSADDLMHGFPRVQIVAAEGRGIVPWLESIAMSDSLPLGRRWAALYALGLMRDSVASAFLMSVVSSPAANSSGPLADAAEAALVGSFDNATCSFWRTRLTKLPRGEVRANAIAGLGFCEPSDSVLIRNAERGLMRLSIVHVAADSAVSRLRRSAYARRVRGPWGALPQPDGRYVPSEGVRRRIVAWMCPNGCPAEPLPPTYVPPEKDRL